MVDERGSQSGQAKMIKRRAFLRGGTAVAAGLAVASLWRSPTLKAKESSEVTIVNFKDDGTNLGKETVPKIAKTDKEWREQLGANSYTVTRRAGTEPPYTGVSWNEHNHGIYRCICCETALFSSETKFESGTGWPSFWAPLAKENIVKVMDASLDMIRTEVRCARCSGHLGHLFPDGPKPTGLRYCMNSASLRFAKA